jgi:hypothetical protein
MGAWTWKEETPAMQDAATMEARENFMIQYMYIYSVVKNE